MVQSTFKYNFTIDALMIYFAYLYHVASVTHICISLMHIILFCAHACVDTYTQGTSIYTNFAVYAVLIFEN